MSLSTQALGFLSKNLGPGAIWQIATQGFARAKDVGSYTKSVLLGSWDGLQKDNPVHDTVKLLKLGLGGLGGLWTGSTMVRNYEEGRAVMSMSGNKDGSIVWSGAQALLQAFSTGLTVGGMLMPNGPARWIMKNIPSVAVIPSLGALAMDHFQSICTCTNKHFLGKMAQFGMSNWMINFKTSESPGTAFRSTLFPWWSRNIRTLDEKFLQAVGLNFKRPHYLKDANYVSVA